MHAMHSHYSVMTRCHGKAVTVMVTVTVTVTVMVTVCVQCKNPGYNSINMMLWH